MMKKMPTEKTGVLPRWPDDLMMKDTDLMHLSSTLCTFNKSGNKKPKVQNFQNLQISDNSKDSQNHIQIIEIVLKSF